MLAHAAAIKVDGGKQGGKAAENAGDIGATRLWRAAVEFGRSIAWKKARQGSSFLKKRSKRLLFLRERMDPGHGLDPGSGGDEKVFWFFSSEKNILGCSHAGDCTEKPEL
jgi:hypothetical protein